MDKFEGCFRWFENTSEERNKVIFLSDKTSEVLDINEEQRKELLHVDKYVSYSRNTYDNEFKAYTLYQIEDRLIDQNNNLILFGEYEYYNE